MKLLAAAKQTEPITLYTHFRFVSVWEKEAMPTELQWERLISLVQVLGQTRWCIFNLYLSGDILFVEARHCDGSPNIHLYLFDLNGELLL